MQTLVESILLKNLEVKVNNESDNPTDDVSIGIDEQLKYLVISAQALENQCAQNADF